MNGAKTVIRMKWTCELHICRDNRLSVVCWRTGINLHFILSTTLVVRHFPFRSVVHGLSTQQEEREWFKISTKCEKLDTKMRKFLNAMNLWTALCYPVEVKARSCSWYFSQLVHSLRFMFSLFPCLLFCFLFSLPVNCKIITCLLQKQVSAPECWTIYFIDDIRLMHSYCITRIIRVIFHSFSHSENIVTLSLFPKASSSDVFIRFCLKFLKTFFWLNFHLQFDT